MTQLTLIAEGRAVEVPGLPGGLAVRPPAADGTTFPAGRSSPTCSLILGSAAGGWRGC
jgi:hypothetical protein